MPSTPRLPFLVTPYPDEILGSWLHRLKIYNHTSLIQQLSGITTRQKLNKTEWRDITKPSPELDCLLKALGVTYTSTMMELTTYPYWLRFHSAKKFDWRSGSSEIPPLILKGRRLSLSRFRNLLPNLLKICPACLDEDTQKYGETYLRRAHHLPYVRICHKHKVNLISRCPQCNQIFRLESTFIHARIICECKFDLRNARSPKTALHPAWEKLAIYSAEVLFSKEIFSECETFYQFLDSRLANNGVTKRPDLLANLSVTYGDDAAKAMLCLSRQGSDHFTYSPIGWVSKRDLRAPQICALLASFDSSFTQTRGLLDQHNFASGGHSESETEQATIRATGRIPKIPRSVAEARKYVSDIALATGGKNTIRSLIYWRHKKLFWYLVIFDRLWFDRHFQSGRRGDPQHLPSLENDRQEILNAIAKAPRHSVKIWTNLAQQAFFRASLRDLQWLEDRKRETLRLAEKERIANRLMELQTFINEVMRAIEGKMIDSIEEIVLSPVQIAPYTTLSQSQIKYIFYQNPEIRKYLLGRMSRLRLNDQSGPSDRSNKKVSFQTIVGAIQVEGRQNGEMIMAAAHKGIMQDFF